MQMYTTIRVLTTSAFWPVAVARASSEGWNQWRETYRDCLDALSVWSSNSDLIEVMKVQFLRFNLCEPGKRYFESLSIKLDCYVVSVQKDLGLLRGPQVSVFMACFIFCCHRQTHSETIDDFINRLMHTAWDCAFGLIEPEIVERVMLLQVLI